MAFVLKVGSSGNLVSSLQKTLVDSGFLSEKARGTSNIDGKFGRITRDAVLKFQEKNNLTQDGAVGEKTAAALGLALANTSAISGHVLTGNQLKRLAEIVDILIPTGPFDLFDDSAIAWLVKKLDGFLADHIPPNILKMLNDLSSGIEGHDMGSFKKRLTDAINKNVSVPLLSEETEEKVIYFFVDVIVDALSVGRDFDCVAEKLMQKAAA